MDQGVAVVRQPVGRVSIAYLALRLLLIAVVATAAGAVGACCTPIDREVEAPTSQPGRSGRVEPEVCNTRLRSVFCSDLKKAAVAVREKHRSDPIETGRDVEFCRRGQRCTQDEDSSATPMRVGGGAEYSPFCTVRCLPYTEAV